MRTATILTLGICAGLVLNACQTEPGTLQPRGTASVSPTSQATAPATVANAPDVLVSARKRQTAPAAPDADIQTLAAGNTAFGLDLYKALSAQTGNLIFSPYSVSQALVMTYAGARGKTETQMAAALRFGLPQSSLHRTFNALDLALMKPPAVPESEGTGFQLSIANSIWGQKGYTFLPGFLDVLGENYGAGLRLADFVAAPEPARLAINQWVSDTTRDKIKDLIPSGAITPDTRLVLANAIYFKAGWQTPFEPSLTHDGPFTLMDGKQVSAKMMSLAAPAGLRYGKGGNYQAVALPYKGGRASMLVLVPDAGHFAEVQSGLTSARLAQIEAGLQTRQVALSLPKFSFESETSLAGPLASLGMPDAFTPGLADFSGMDGARNLLITAVLHKAFVAVDEQGTEAAAATAVIVGLAAVPLTDVTLTVDRPFIFVIRDDATGTVLFMGQVLTPKAD
jgi:serpin B